MTKPKKNILHRAKIAEGHLRKVINMIDEDAYCIDVLNQSLAVQNALKKIDELVLENHLNSCVVRQINDGKAKEATKEILKIFKKK